MFLLKRGLLIFALAVGCRSQIPSDIYRQRVPREQQPYAAIAPSIGRVLLTDSKYFGGLALSVAIEQEYVHIKELPEILRAEFFFVVATKTHLDASFSLEFTELIARDCPDAFERRAAEFLAKFGEADAEPEVRKARVYLESVRQLREKP